MSEEWTPTRVSILIALWNEGLTTSAIGKKLGVPKESVANIVKHQLKIVGKRGTKPIVYKKDKAGQYKLPILGLG